MWEFNVEVTAARERRGNAGKVVATPGRHSLNRKQSRGKVVAILCFASRATVGAQRSQSEKGAKTPKSRFCTMKRSEQVSGDPSRDGQVHLESPAATVGF